MIKIYVCVGSSCHIRSSHDIVKALETCICQRQLQDHIELKGTFCLGRCSEGANILIDGSIISGIKVDRIEEIIKGLEDRIHDSDQNQ